MRIDLFEFVESVFRGFVYFLYNVIETVWTLARHPMRGPLRLHRAYLRSGKRQIGGLTFLFLVFFTLFGLAGDADLMSKLSRMPRFDSDASWTLILSAMVSTVAIDAIVRLYLRWRFPSRPQKRQMLLAVFEYSLVWPILLMVLVPLLTLLALQGEDFTTVLLGLAVAILIVGPLLSVAACAPAAACLLLANKRRPAGQPRTGKAWFVRIPVQLGVFALLVGAGVAGGAVAMRVTEAEQKEVEEPAPTQLVPVAVHCRQQGPSIRVDVAIANPTARPMLVDPAEELLLEVRGMDQAQRRFTLSAAAETAGAQLFAAGETRLVRLLVPRGEVGAACVVHGVSGGRVASAAIESPGR